MIPVLAALAALVADKRSEEMDLLVERLGFREGHGPEDLAECADVFARFLQKEIAIITRGQGWKVETYAEKVWVLSLLPKGVRERLYHGSGISRSVWTLDETHVVKVAHNYASRWQNQVEATVWQYAPDELRPLLGRIDVWDPDYNWIVMQKLVPYADVHDAPETGAYVHQQVHPLFALADRYSIQDMIPDNVGLDEDRTLKIMDYGHTSLRGWPWAGLVPPPERR